MSSEQLVDESEWRHERRDLDALLRSARAVLDHRSFDAAARAIFDEACQITGATAGYVALLSSTGDENEVVFLEDGGMGCAVNLELPMPIRGLRAEAYATNRVTWDNAFADGKWTDLLPDGHVELRNVMFAPLVLDGRTVGLMGLANKPDGGFSEDDARIARAFGEFAALALRNSRVIDELNQTVAQLESALEEVRTLEGFIPICARCQKIRDDEGYWQRVEEFIGARTGAEFTHGYCPACAEGLKAEYRGSGPKDS